MKKRGEMSRSYAKGMTILIFFILAVQTAIFTIKSYEQMQISITRDTVPVNQTEPTAEKRSEKGAKTITAEPDIKTKARIKSENFHNANDDNNVNDDSNVKEEDVIRETYVPVDIKTIRSDIRIELNSADSADLVSLPGIGPFYAAKILDYRQRLGGFAFKEQLMEVYGVDNERFALFRDRVWADTTKIKRLRFSEASQEELSANPYIGAYTARAIVKYREVEGSSGFNLASLVANRIIKAELEKILKYYLE